MNDDTPTEPPRPGHRWARSDYGGGAWIEEKIPGKKTTPEGELKKRIYKAYKEWKLRNPRIAVRWLKYSVGKFMTVDGQREYYLGTPGVSDIMIGICGTCLMVEAKVAPRKQSKNQIRMQATWCATGNAYVLAYKPYQVTDALDQIVAQRGKLF